VIEEIYDPPDITDVMATEATTAVVHKPLEPIMGGLTQTDHDKWCAWTGGIPKLDWTGLEVEATDYDTPNQLRSIYNVKGYNHGKGGLSLKFNKTNQLVPFKKSIWNHLQENGLDTVTYLPDMRKVVSSVIYDHSRYTLESTRK
jgi:hypothetical protein